MGSMCLWKTSVWRAWANPIPQESEQYAKQKHGAKILGAWGVIGLWCSLQHRIGRPTMQEWRVWPCVGTVTCAWMDSAGVKWSTQKTQGRPAAFDLLKYQQGMPYSKQKGWVKQSVSMSPGLNYYVLLSSSTPLPLWFQVWHQSVSCRVAGTGSTRQQLPVCSAEGYASHAVVVCQPSPES